MVKGIAILKCVLSCWLLFGLGCSRHKNANIVVQEADLVGVWLLAEAPAAVSNALPKQVGVGSIELKTNGSAEVHLLPSVDPIPSPSGSVSPWSLDSGSAKWSMRDWGHNSYHAWRVGLETERTVVQLRVRLNSSDQLILVYTPNPDREEDSVVFKRASVTH
jgi:hypothetical protein